MSKTRILLAFFSVIILLQGFDAQAQDARKRWETLNLIRREKLAIILPKAMRENKIDMWIIVNKFGHSDLLSKELGAGKPSDKWNRGEFLGYTIFTDRGGDSIERSILSGRLLNERGALRKFVEERNPKRIGINMSYKVGVADGLSHTCYLSLVKALGEKYTKRLVSAEQLVGDFRSQRVMSEIVLYAKATELTKEFMERGLSNEVITPGVTTLGDVGWWIQDQMLARGFTFRDGFPGVSYPKRARSRDYIIQRGDLLSWDWGIIMMNFYGDMKRHAYVLREGETDLPPSIKNTFEQGLKVRKILRKHIKPGRTGIETLELLYRKVEEAGFERCEVEFEVSDSKKTEVNIGMHSVGNQHHGAGPAIWKDKPLRREMVLKPTQLFSFEYFMLVPLPEWGGKKLIFGIEDNVIMTENGVEWLYPVMEKINLIR